MVTAKLLSTGEVLLVEFWGEISFLPPKCALSFTAVKGDVAS